MDPQKMNYEARQAHGQAQEKGSNLLDKAGNAAQSAKETVQEAGNQMLASAQGAADAVKNATGINQNQK
ncbi:stress-induced protein KIN2 [Trifolium repens]|nr:stress-induced protein KIN2 [Trifolium repens]